SKTYA
ncbi:hypothetical protein MK338_08045, partial [Streptococcus vestibularis]